ncbi:hypothetical protein Tco_1444624 [Tanacetum coccineum]
MVPLSMTYLRRARMTVRPKPPMVASTKALISEYAYAPTPPSPPSPLSPLSSPLPRIPSLPLLLLPLHTSPTYASAPLGYRATMLYGIPEADMLSRKRLCLTALAFQFEVGESSTATVSRQTRHTLARRVDYGFIDTLDTSIQASEGIVMTAVEDVNERVTDLVSTQRRDAHEFYVRHEDAQDDRALLRAQISLLMRERRYFRSMSLSYEREAVYARQAWSRSEDKSTALEALIRAHEAHIIELEAHIRAL